MSRLCLLLLDVCLCNRYLVYSPSAKKKKHPIMSRWRVWRLWSDAGKEDEHTRRERTAFNSQKGKVRKQWWSERVNDALISDRVSYCGISGTTRGSYKATRETEIGGTAWGEGGPGLPGRSEEGRGGVCVGRGVNDVYEGRARETVTAGGRPVRTAKAVVADVKWEWSSFPRPPSPASPLRPKSYLSCRRSP